MSGSLAAILVQVHWHSSDLDISALPPAGTIKYNLNERPGGARNFAQTSRSSRVTSTPPVMHTLVPAGCLAALSHFNYFQRNVTMFPPAIATIRHGVHASRSCGQPPTHLNGKTQISLCLAVWSHRRHCMASPQGRPRRPLLHRSRKRTRHCRRLRPQVQRLGT
jgi:hypothetical protein